MRLKTIAKSIMRTLGLAIYRIPRTASETNGGYSYSQHHPNATYAPWLDDQKFMNCYEIVKSQTLVDIYRMYELWDLVGQMTNIHGDIVEVGVWRGGTGCLMATRAQQAGLTSTIYLCDTFKGVVKAGSMDSGYAGGEHEDTSISIVKSLANRLSLSNIRILTGIFPEETGQQVESRGISLLHIDVDVYESARGSVEYLWDRLVLGGVVVFDDFGFVGCEGVTRYVHELVARNRARFIYNLNGHALVVKL